MVYRAIMKQCEKYGHDWAIQDLGTWMCKICLRCGQEQFFYPADKEDENDE